ncbi:dienelactone hydrolase family protein [Paenibacillus sp. JDR-2]|uniref:dienelactone hydrolase family protein n=1 Tax=Paenibacillus sp. (strain JDR-2) TaxID=324057 RepID=UPI000166A629|nr:alpha/beta hydrolase family protein [Paenibacillus sp. JDR-2]ACT00655.1 Dienelactone hydrolase-like protein [Paenibacillus sp. JDR-2]
MWSPDDLLESLYKETIEQHKEQSQAMSNEERRSSLLESLRGTIGAFPTIAQGKKPRLLERTDCGSYIRERVELSGIEGISFAAYILIPKGLDGPLPGVLAIHGHGYGSREIIGLLPDGSPDDGEPTCHNRFALDLVGRGMIVMAPDVVGFGERMLAEDLGKDPRSNSSCYKLATSLLLQGLTLTGLRTTELLAALDYLESYDQVDSRRIGAMGFSGGALLAWTCAALDERLQAVVLSGFPGTFKGTIMSVHHCVDNYIPGMLTRAELPEWISLIAPRPLFVESGFNDPIFPSESALEAISDLQQVYDNYEKKDNFSSDVFPGIHEVSGRRAFDWLKRQLTAGM